MSYVKLVGTTDPSTNGTSRAIINGKEVVKDVPVDLTADEKKKLEGFGLVFESSSKSEAKDVDEQTVTDEAVLAEPVIKDPENLNPGQGDDQETKGTKSSKK